jgi:hypothetical protein
VHPRCEDQTSFTEIITVYYETRKYTLWTNAEFIFNASIGGTNKSKLDLGGDKEEI